MLTDEQLRQLLGLIPLGRRAGTDIPTLSREMDLDQRLVRAGIAHLVRYYGHPIATLTSPHGVFYATTDADYQATDTHLSRKAMAILVRRRAFRLAWQRRVAFNPNLIGGTMDFCAIIDKPVERGTPCVCCGEPGEACCPDCPEFYSLQEEPDYLAPDDISPDHRSA